MKNIDAVRVLEQHKAIIRDTHVVYTSGKHGSTYINKDAIYPNTRAVSSLCQEIAAQFTKDAIEIVAAPAIGGVILSQWVAYHLSTKGHIVLAIYAEKGEQGSFIFRRGYDQLLKDKRVLIVEDVLTTGASLKEVIQAVRINGGIVIGAAALCNRGDVTIDQVGNPPKLCSLLELSLDTWDEDGCPLCNKGVPINIDVGKGREFIIQKGLHKP
ncbi:MAG: phosphoribosyltransferase family protein [Blastocatellia bacterium]